MKKDKVFLIAIVCSFFSASVTFICPLVREDTAWLINDLSYALRVSIMPIVFYMVTENKLLKLLFLNYSFFTLINAVKIYLNYSGMYPEAMILWKLQLLLLIISVAYYVWSDKRIAMVR